MNLDTKVIPEIFEPLTISARQVLGKVSSDDLTKMAAAGAEVQRCTAVLARTNANPVGEILRHSEGFYEWSHYPEDDVYDPETHSQYYYHTHPPETRPWGEHGHFHIFVRREGMPAGIDPSLAVLPPNTGDSLCHLVAISMDDFGRPVRLFTTNRWVTGETWYAAHNVIAILPYFNVDVVRPNWVVNRWLTALVRLFQPQIAELIQRRDHAIAEWKGVHPYSDVFEDRNLEVTSQVEVDVDEQLETVQKMLRDRKA
ncbi:MAG: hypothetical protein AB7M05_08310 [Alphaproteobacteria bacterium]